MKSFRFFGPTREKACELRNVGSGSIAHLHLRTLMITSTRNADVPN
ncbi:hypothetical protein ALC56_12751 [Trachymyrmex septentrionalis]|uniref:Uncharacterized protein n=1 Tax=Trachymyrmex septentrionalis TaxID=34720 RepID=A0A195EXC8_9HYME|nr:hypothetical protein ALC56_12751 [Trachymyrmex septentrionalis]